MANLDLSLYHLTCLVYYPSNLEFVNKDPILERERFINTANWILEIMLIAMESFFMYISLFATKHFLELEAFLVNKLKGTTLTKY